MGNKVNELLDNLSAFLWRLYDLPIAFLVLCTLMAGLGVWLLLWVMARKRGRSLPGVTSGFVLLIALQIVHALVSDRRASQLKREMRDMRESTLSALLDKGKSGYTGGLESILAGGKVDANTTKDQIPRELRGVFPSWNAPFSYRSWQIDPGIDYHRFTYEKPQAVVHIVIVDLDTGLYEIALPPDVTKKTTTSVFATKDGALVAVNGECGVTPAMNAPLGEWKGNYIVNGHAIFLDDDAHRPFLSFDQNAKGRYFPAAIVDVTNTPDKYNTIWGRFDLLIGRKLAIPTEDLSATMRYPRTILGLDPTGRKLFLMVVDGSNPGYSMGLTMEECGKILIGLGCTDAMACDQGGSTCMYIDGTGIASRPSGGTDRHVLTHFGVRRASKPSSLPGQPHSDAPTEGAGSQPQS